MFTRLTLNGMYVYDSSFFDNIDLPETLNKGILITEIISKSGDLYPYYQVPSILKINIEAWFARKKILFQKMIDAIYSDYIPIHNYDRYEKLQHNDTNSGGDKEVETRNDTLNNTSSYTPNTSTIETTNGTNVAQVSAYNADAFQNREKNNIDNVTTIDNSGTDNSTSNNINNYNTNNNKTYGHIIDSSDDNHLYGNIGVTTTQAMILEEIEMRKVADIYRIISDLFESEFIVQLY